jgi:hypothetical protein
MTTDTHSAEQAQAQLDSIRDMVRRLEHAQDGHDIDACDLTADCQDCDGGTIKVVDAGEIVEEDCATCDGTGSVWTPLEYEDMSFEDFHDEDQARERIYEDPLEVLVRSGWSGQGAELTPEEFSILLCTGGPAVRIRGELNEYGEPSRAWLEHQDWGTPWTEYHGDHDTEALIAYASQFLGG